MNEGFKHKKSPEPEIKSERKRNHGLRDALIAAGALAATIVASPKEESAQELVVVGASLQQNQDHQDQIRDLMVFSDLLKRQKLEDVDLLQLEDLVKNEKVPLTQQIHFMERVFKRGGEYDRIMSNPRLSPAMLSKILHLNTVVSARMIQAYEKNPYDPTFKEYFSIDQVFHATGVRTPAVKPGSGEDPSTKTKFFNVFRAQYKGKVYEIGPKHGVQNTSDEENFVLSRTADQAARLISPEEQKAMGITHPSQLPEISDAITAESAMGKVLVSLSYGPNLQPKLYFSFAMYLPNPARKILAGENNTWPQEYRTSVNLITPPTETKILQRVNGRVTRSGASGSSGSPVAVSYGGKLRILGEFQAVRTVDEPCLRVCYSVAFSGTTDTLTPLLNELQMENRHVVDQQKQKN